MSSRRKHLLDRLHIYGCGIVDVGLSDEEKVVLHSFKTKVADLGTDLYAKMDPEKVDAFLVKAVFSIIQDQLKE